MHLDVPITELPVRLRFERPLSDEALMRFCAVNEVLPVERNSNGELIVMGPGRRWAGEDGRGVAFDSNTGFTLRDGSMRSPDAAWIAWERWNALTLAQQESFAPICPEFLVELRSKTDNLSELREKMVMWVANGAEVAWMIDPERKVVDISRPGMEVEVLAGGSVVEGDGPVSAFVLELRKILG